MSVPTDRQETYRGEEIPLMYAPAPHDEITGLVNYLEVQLSAIRAAPRSWMRWKKRSKFHAER